MNKRRRLILGEGKDGPTLIDPPKPKPYYTCGLCNFFEQEMACSGGLEGSPTYYKTCIHPDVHTDYMKGRSLNTGHNISSHRSKDVTPSWCPLLESNKNNNNK
jgi:hypothetical protein